MKGKTVFVPSVQIDGRTVITTGKWLKIAAVRDEELVEGDTVADPESFVLQLKKSGLKADLFTFAQRATRQHTKVSLSYGVGECGGHSNHHFLTLVERVRRVQH